MSGELFSYYGLLRNDTPRGEDFKDYASTMFTVATPTVVDTHRDEHRTNLWSPIGSLTCSSSLSSILDPVNVVARQDELHTPPHVLNESMSIAKIGERNSETRNGGVGVSVDSFETTGTIAAASLHLMLPAQPSNLSVGNDDVDILQAAMVHIPVRIKE